MERPTVNCRVVTSAAMNHRNSSSSSSSSYKGTPVTETSLPGYVTFHNILLTRHTWIYGRVLSLLFLPRKRLCIARTMPSQDVSLFVCLSVRHTPVFYRNSYTYPLLFNHRVAVECKGYEKIAIFSQYIALSRKCDKIEP